MATMDSMPPDTRAFVSMYKWHRIDPVPWAQPSKPLSESRIGLVISACMVMHGQPPFDAEKPDNDPTMRVIPSGIDPRVLENTYPGQGFDHTGLEADPNLLVPLDRLREMAAAGEIGELAPRVVSICGHLPKPRVLIEETAPQIANVFIEDAADAVLLVPA
jgi:D-proline reductase (dithiol) PrdB